MLCFLKYKKPPSRYILILLEIVDNLYIVKNLYNISILVNDVSHVKVIVASNSFEPASTDIVYCSFGS